MSQDTLKYCELDNGFVTNCLYFHKTNKLSSKGTFSKKTTTDNSENWSAKGSFTENKKKIKLDAFKLIKTRYNLNSDNSDKNKYISDTTFVKKMILYKKGKYLIEKRQREKWWKKREIFFYQLIENTK